MNKFKDGVLVIIDDNVSFLKAADKELKESFESVITIPCAKFNDDDIVDQIMTVRPDYLLIDINLNIPTRSRDLLRKLAKSGSLLHCSVYIISFGGGSSSHNAHLLGNVLNEDSDEHIVNEYQKISSRVVGPLIRKPISAFALRAVLKGVGHYEPPYEWNVFPLPLRVLGKDGSVKYVNQAWKRANIFKPDPVDFPDWINGGKVPGVKYYHGNPFDNNSAGYNVHSFLLEQNFEEFLGQVIDNNQRDRLSSDFQKIVENIFSAMSEAGFPRGQCFVFYPLVARNSNFDGARSTDGERNSDVEVVVHLEHVTDNHPESVRKHCGNSEAPAFVLPLRGELARRMKQYQDRKERAQKSELIYSIRYAHEDEQSSDPDIKRWAEILEQTRSSQGYAHAWIEIPVIAKSETLPFYIGSEKYQVVAMLMFNNSQVNAASGKNLHDSFVSDITTDSLLHLTVLLKNLIDKLLDALIKRSDIRFKSRYEFISREDKHFLDGNGDSLESKKERLLKAVGVGTKSDYALLLKKDLSKSQLVLDCCWCKDSDKHLKKIVSNLAVPLDDEFKAMNVVNAWLSGKPSYIQCVNESQYTEVVEKCIENDKSPLNCDAKQSFKLWTQWLNANVQGGMAYPIIVGKECVGLIVLYYRKPWMMLAKHMQTLFEFSHRARWILQSAYKEEERRIWLLSIAHEMLGEINTSSHALSGINNAEFTETTFGRELSIANKGLVASADLVKNWMTYLGREDPLNTESFDPVQEIQDTIDLYKEYLAVTRSRLNLQSIKTDTIHFRLANKPIFTRVLRVLINNCMKHGRAYLNKAGKYSEILDIRCSWSYADGFFCLVFENPGTLPNDYENVLFSGVKDYSNDADGAGIGLFVAKSLVNKVGGEIKLDNAKSGEVKSLLKWPVAIQGDGNE